MDYAVDDASAAFLPGGQPCGAGGVGVGLHVAGGDVPESLPRRSVVGVAMQQRHHVHLLFSHTAKRTINVVKPRKI